MAIDKVFYNQASAAKLDWDSSWFSCEYNDEILVQEVRKWQKERGLSVDGLVGPMTYRRIWTERQLNISDWMDNLPPQKRFKAGEKYIIHNGNFIPIEWDKVILWDEEGGLKIKPGRYYDNSGKPDRKPKMFVNHWDVCLSAASCAQVLNKRGISVHFCLDNDGTIYQILDTQHGAWHCSKQKGNKTSVGIEISNAYYPKYQDWYVKQGHGKRPMMEEGIVHGVKLDPFTWFYPVQIRALQALWKAIHIGLGIPLDYPSLPDGSLNTSVHKDCANGKFKGYANHYNFVRTKIDCAGLDLPKLLGEVKRSPMYCLDD
ncbi:MAG TPA: hypothetical protein EYO96_00625 [Candidatus Marinimicrobia bacterium]|nr:hypothetical protein [Candidatus Neomarinimicrobiota bacterium]